jgi:hypothetical protein
MTLCPSKKIVVLVHDLHVLLAARFGCRCGSKRLVL